MRVDTIAKKTIGKLINFSIFKNKSLMIDADWWIKGVGKQPITIPKIRAVSMYKLLIEFFFILDEGFNRSIICVYFMKTFN